MPVSGRASMHPLHIRIHPRQYHAGYHGRQVDAVTASPYDEPLSALREHVEDIAVWVEGWEHRQEPDARARRCAADAVDAIDAALRELHAIRARLTGEIRTSDDASAACGLTP
jgi:hypothetical protein